MAHPDTSLYIACGLTQAPEDFKAQVEELKDGLRDRYEVFDFVGLVNGSNEDVYHWDIGHCVAQSTLLVAVCDYPAIGLGWELGTRVEKLEKPTLAVAHEDSHITRLILGVDNKPHYRFQRYADLLLDLPIYIDEAVEQIHAGVELSPAHATAEL